MRTGRDSDPRGGYPVFHDIADDNELTTCAAQAPAFRRGVEQRPVGVLPFPLLQLDRNAIANGVWRSKATATSCSAASTMWCFVRNSGVRFWCHRLMHGLRR